MPLAGKGRDKQMVIAKFIYCFFFFFFQAEDGIRDWSVTGVQTCALPIWEFLIQLDLQRSHQFANAAGGLGLDNCLPVVWNVIAGFDDVVIERRGTFAEEPVHFGNIWFAQEEIGRASCRERV